jgi:lipopolysaccharide transport system ATP-binding protein
MLCLGPGEYTSELGLASVQVLELIRRHTISHNEGGSILFNGLGRDCAGRFSVDFAIRDGVSVLSHHGAADLPSSIAREIVR